MLPSDVSSETHVHTHSTSSKVKRMSKKREQSNHDSSSAQKRRKTVKHEEENVEAGVHAQINSSTKPYHGQTVSEMTKSLARRQQDLMMKLLFPNSQEFAVKSRNKFLNELCTVAETKLKGQLQELKCSPADQQQQQYLAERKQRLKSTIKKIKAYKESTNVNCKLCLILVILFAYPVFREYFTGKQVMGDDLQMKNLPGKTCVPRLNIFLSQERFGIILNQYYKNIPVGSRITHGPETALNSNMTNEHMNLPLFLTKARCEWLTCCSHTNAKTAVLGAASDKNM